MSAITDLSAQSSQALNALNNAFAKETSFLDAADWVRLTGMACFSFATPDAFIIAFDQDADYDSQNFLWFRDRFERFVYIDRVVVAASAHGQGLGRRLYEKLFADAKAAGFPCVLAEVNTNPPNPGSIGFHTKMGFDAVEDVTWSPEKSVRYFARTL
jgi:predicted GNAT superfamily acetyltransferase